ncbi:MAG: iron-sulfur cluster assembly scaffold protein [Candidatus Peribacteraceae bacterium]|jgi:nitrogen fixation NifU-like protein|nr:iron-sulfur cluster assembly scaffold protein [Candidatus Peribacteraceae bacterium]
MDLYADNILDHYRDPRNKSESPITNDQSLFDVVHTEKNISCGDEITVALDIENESIASIKWSGIGCAISQAGMSILSEEIEGMSTAEILKMQKDDVYEMLGVPIGPRRFKCALISLHTVKNALRKNAQEKPQSWLETVEMDEG